MEQMKDRGLSSRRAQTGTWWTAYTGTWEWSWSPSRAAEEEEEVVVEVVVVAEVEDSDEGSWRRYPHRR